MEKIRKHKRGMSTILSGGSLSPHRIQGIMAEILVLSSVGPLVIFCGRWARVVSVWLNVVGRQIFAVGRAPSSSLGDVGETDAGFVLKPLLVGHFPYRRCHGSSEAPHEEHGLHPPPH